jgi:hypothetical protein
MPLKALRMKRSQVSGNALNSRDEIDAGKSELEGFQVTYAEA